jgi:hypothetical protein
VGCQNDPSEYYSIFLTYKSSPAAIIYIDCRKLWDTVSNPNRCENSDVFLEFDKLRQSS